MNEKEQNVRKKPEAKFLDKDESTQEKMCKICRETFTSCQIYREHKGKDGVSILPALLRPKSTGTIRLASTNHHDHPLIDPQYLKHPDDVKTLVEALKIVKNIYDLKHFKYDFFKVNSV